MSDVIEIYNEYKELGIKTRKITQGSEFNLVKEFIEYRKNQFEPSDTNKLIIFIEPKVNNSYPDIVFVEYNPNNYENWNSSRNELISIDFKILYHIFVTKQIDGSDIVSGLGITWKDTLLSLERLYDAKLIIRKNNSWRIKDKKIFSVKKIEAVEAKLNKLDDVFQQALINKNFASESYALSNMSRGIDKAKINRFDEFGIGLYTHAKNEFRLIAEPSKSPIPVNFSSIYFNEWIGRILSKNEGRYFS